MSDEKWIAKKKEKKNCHLITNESSSAATVELFRPESRCIASIDR